MENKKKELWDLTKDSWHVKFWLWLWGIDAPSHYKTACPYYWQYGGTILILPFVLLFKFGIWLWSPIDAFLDVRAERNAKEYVARLIKEMHEADTDEKRYKLYNSKCYRKYKSYAEFKEEDNYLMKSLVYQGYERFLTVVAERKKFAQAKVDAFRYGAGGKIVSFLIGLVFISFIAWGGYELLHLFTWKEFIYGLKLTGGVMLVIGIVVGIIIGMSKLIKNYWCDSWIAKIVFWKYIGMFFKLIWTGVLMTVDMIKSTYNNNCPTINWK